MKKNCNMERHRLAERIIHTVKAAFTTDKENTAILCSDISNAYNERHRAKMLSTLYSRPELRHLWRCADLMYASGPTRLITRIDGINVVLETNCMYNGRNSRVLNRREPFQSGYHGGPKSDTGRIQRTYCFRLA